MTRRVPNPFPANQSARATALAVGLIVSVYLPLLRAPFDFVDDGLLVYPAPAMSGVARVRLAWDKILADHERLGPFRPLAWAHWEAQANLLGANPLRWRSARLLWAALATASMLWLLRELHIPAPAAYVTTAIAMWNPSRGEIWRSLTMSEGVAMPYALAALACALRGGRSSRPGRWDAAGALLMLAALGCKNTFAAVVPAQMLLRIAPDGEPLRQAWRRHGARAAVLLLPLLLPLGHLLVFVLTWHSGQYRLQSPTLTQLRRMLDRVRRGLSLELIGAGLVLALAALRSSQLRPPRAAASLLSEIRHSTALVWARHRAAGRAGLALLVAGIAVYLPMGGVCDHYAVPAVWGADLWVAALLGTLAVSPPSLLKRAAGAVLGVALAVVVGHNLAKQDQFVARAALLWDVVGWIETDTLPGATIGWVEGPQLNAGEGIHAAWHLRGRGGAERRVQLIDGRGMPVDRPELPPAPEPPRVIVTGGGVIPWQGDIARALTFTRPYWFGTRQYTCTMWQRDRAQGGGERKS